MQGKASSFRAPYAPPDEAIAAGLLEQASAGADAERRIDAYATRLIEGIRGQRRRARRNRGFPPCLFAVHQGGAGPHGAGGGALARARCRHRRPADRGQARDRRLVVPQRQIERAVGRQPRPGRSASPLASSSPARRPDTILESLIKRLGLPAVRAATRQAMRLLASHFVLGQTIEEALERAARRIARCAIPSTCWERARARLPTPSAISPPTPMPSMPSARARARPHRRAVPASRSSSPPCIHASRRYRATACLTELVPKALELARKARDA